MELVFFTYQVAPVNLIYRQAGVYEELSDQGPSRFGESIVSV